MTKTRSVAATANDNAIPGSRIEDGTIDGSKFSPSLGLGADEISFTQADSTVESNVQNKLEESVSVLDFIPVSEHAAIRDNTSTYDCTQAIRDALRDSFEIFFPAGTYNVTSTISITWKNPYLPPTDPAGRGWGEKTIRGVREKSIIKTSFAGIVFNFDYIDGAGITGLQFKKPLVENLRFENDDFSLLEGPDYEDLIAIYFRYTSQAVVRQCKFTGYFRGIHHTGQGGNGSNYSQIQSCTFTGAGGPTAPAQFSVSVDGSAGATVCLFIHNCVSQNTGYDLRGSIGSRIVHSDISNPRGPVYLGDFNQIVQCYTERFNVNGTSSPTGGFPWYILGDRCQIRDSIVDCTATEMNVQQTSNNAIFKFTGRGSLVEGCSSDGPAVILYFDDREATGGNKIIINSNPTTSTVATNANQRGIGYNTANKTTVVFKDELNGRSISYKGPWISTDGPLTTSECLLSSGQPAVLTNLPSVLSGGTISAIDIALPEGRTNPGAFAKITTTAESFFFEVDGGTMSLDPNEIYSSFMYIYVPSSSVVDTSQGITLTQVPSVDSPTWGVGLRIYAFDEWVPVPRSYLMTSARNSPTWITGGYIIGQPLYVGEFAVSKGKSTAPYPSPYTYP